MADCIICDVWSLSLGLIGIYMSIITMVFATLSSKVEEKRAIENSQDYRVMNHGIAVENSINTLRRFNRKVMYALGSTFLLFLLSTAAKFFTTCWLIAICLMISLLLITCSIGLVYQLFSYYQSDKN